MDLRRAQLDAAAERGLISSAQADALWAFLGERQGDAPGAADAAPSFRASHILYYLGGMLAIGAMSLFMTLGWESFGGWGLFFIALAYAGAALKLAGWFLANGLRIPAGIMVAFVVTLTPLAIYGLQHALGWWAGERVFREYHTHIDWKWLFMEFGTLASAAVLLWRYRLPFAVMPLAVTLWYMSMDIVPFLLGGERGYGAGVWELRKFISLWFGLAMILVAFWVDVRSRREQDYAFWLYLFGVLTFWGGLSLMNSNSELGKFFYFCINLVMIAVGAALARRVFAVFGGLGVAGYIGHLAYSVFRNSLLFPFALTAIGLGVIWLGILWQRHEAGISARLRGALPGPLRALIENAR